MTRWLGLAFLLVVACSSAEHRLIVAAGTTLVDSGLIDAVADRYEELHPEVQLSVVGESTKLVLELGQRGAADFLLVHAPDQEADFVAAGYAATYARVLDSRFIVVGPAELESDFAGLTVEQAFALVSERGLAFVSRSDGSGTNDKEKSIWAALGLDPSRFAWYIATGQGMGPTIQIADQRSAITLAEHGAFASASKSVSIVDLGISEAGLVNPYTGYVVAAGPHRDGAADFLQWLTSPEGAQVILEVNRDLFGEVIYQPLAG